jgi:hypothetical protein
VSSRTARATQSNPVLKKQKKTKKKKKRIHRECRPGNNGVKLKADLRGIGWFP